MAPVPIRVGARSRAKVLQLRWIGTVQGKVSSAPMGARVYDLVRAKLLPRKSRGRGRRFHRRQVVRRLLRNNETRRDAGIPLVERSEVRPSKAAIFYFT